MASNLYVVALRLTPNQNLDSESLLHQQSARTSGSISNFLSEEQQLVNWSEIFFFKVDSPVWNVTFLLLIEFHFVNLFPLNCWNLMDSMEYFCILVLTLFSQMIILPSTSCNFPGGEKITHFLFSFFLLTFNMYQSILVDLLRT